MCSQAISSDENVYFEGNFWGAQKSQRAMTKTPFCKTFLWEGTEWQIPALYTNTKGLVIDFCVKIEPSAIKAFLDKWFKISQDENLSRELEMQITAENPLNDLSIIDLIINGKKLRHHRSCSTCYNPVMLEGIENASQCIALCEKYSCDKQFGWIFIRSSYCWSTTRKPKIKSFLLDLKTEQQPLPSTHFVAKAGENIELVHPVTQQKYKLSIISCKQNKMPKKHFANSDYIFPQYYMPLEYTIKPSIDRELYGINDCSSGDSPLYKKTQKQAGSVGIIGSAHGVALISAQSSAPILSTCSSLYFEPIKNIEWHVFFKTKTKKDLQISLI